MDRMSTRLEVTEHWAFSLPGSLAFIGCLALPEGVVDEALIRGEVPEETERQFRHHATLGRKMLQGIPRLESVAAIVGAVLLFILPGGQGRRALQWEEAQRIDWGIILLYGGGMALGELSRSTGLADALGKSLTGWLPPGTVMLITAATLMAVITSEFTSNTAIANIVVPVAMALAGASGGDPLTAALAATFAASLGFMMPVSTPCNAIVYGTGRIRLHDMIRSGAIIDLAGAVVITLVMLAVGRLWAG
jgi:sodium-dependent dicarboxylate transporter 2/3/5